MSLIRLAQQRAAGYPVEGFIRGEGPEKPKVLLIGEAPGSVEVTATEDTPFSGRAGVELMKFLETAELTRENTYITSAFHSRPFKDLLKTNKRTGEEEVRRYNRKPTRKEMLAHAPLTDYEIQSIDAPIILLSGTTSIERVLGKKAAVKELHGKIIESPVQILGDLNDTDYQWSKEKYTILCTYHPASVFYNRKLTPVIHEDMTNLKQFLSQRENK